MNHRPGFSLLELLIALVVTGIVTMSTTSLLLSGIRSFREQSERARLDADLQLATTFFQSELRGLDPRDSVRSDIVHGTASSIVYRAVRSRRFLCRRADTTNSIVTTWPPAVGLRDFRPDLDSVLLLIMTIDTEYWVGANLLDVSPGQCPGGVTGSALHLGGLSKRRLAALLPGSPVLGSEIAEIKSYQDGDGTWWLGVRRFQKDASRWPAIQPVLGPLASNGFRLDYLGSTGQIVTKHTDVARIRVRITHEAADPSPRRGNPESVIDVALRGGGEG